VPYILHIGRHQSIGGDLTTQWDVDPEDGAQIDEDGLDELQHDLVGVPLVTHESNSDYDSDISIDGPNDLMQ
jgi:hypothetical protein